LEPKGNSQLVQPIPFKTLTVLSTKDVPGTVLDKGISLSQSLLGYLEDEVKFDLYLELSKLYALRGDWDLARQQCDLALSFAPDSLEAAALCQELDEVEKAEASHRQALVDDDQSHDIYLSFLPLLALGEAEEATGEYEQTLTSNPGYQHNAWVQLQRADAYRLTGRGEDSSATYEQVLALHTDNAQVAGWLEELK
jgi:tetratricopeptide (TPR) repeat protein